MAPYPEEIDVFSVPHSRMKQLVDVYNEKLTCMDFADYLALKSFLEDLRHTFYEFKSHEQIENKYIMKKLKQRLKALSIHDAAVCNCHSDNRLSDMLALFDDGYIYSSKPEQERINFGIKLQNALEEFTGVFLPHMKEEEEVFQPMLMKYFEYEELKCLKEQVIREHSKWCTLDPQSDLKSDSETCSTEVAIQLPPEILSHIFSFLTPQEILRCSEVCHVWYNVSRNPALWKELYPCYWAHGIWRDYDTNYEDAIQRLYPGGGYPLRHYQDEDADFDEQQSGCSSSGGGSAIAEKRNVNSKEVEVLKSLVKFLLPKVGQGVQKIVLTCCRALSSAMLREILELCPNVSHLDVSYTCIADSAFKGLKDSLACANVQYVNMSGCKGITDLGLYRLAECVSSSFPHLPDGSTDLRDVYLENCCQLSSLCVSNENFEIEESGCYFNGCRASEWCLDGSADQFCTSICFWKKNGFMCHMARQVQQCPFMNASFNCDSLNVSLAAEQVLRTTEENAVCRTVMCQNDKGSATAGDQLVHSFRYLNLSGCKEITDDGFRCLSDSGVFSQLEFLDVSGCWQLTGATLRLIASLAPILQPENLYYCDQIEDGPYPETANGCQNLENEFRACCCNRFPS